MECTKQLSLTKFFSEANKSKETTASSPTPQNSSGTSNVKESTTDTETVKSMRSLKVATANQWKSTTLASYVADEWLILNQDEKSGNVTSFNCSVCKSYAEKINGMKNYSEAWAFTGSFNLRVSNAISHAKGEPHKRAMNLYMRERKGMNASQCAEFLRDTPESQQLITTGIANMNASEVASLTRMYEVAYFIAKEELPLTKYTSILKLEEKHGVDIGPAYRSDKSCSDFISFISKDIELSLSKKLFNCNFISVLTDGSSDVSITEKEAVFVQYLNTNPPDSDTVKIVTSFVSLQEPKHANAGGIVACIRNSFKEIGMPEETLHKKLIGFAADGATVNRGHKEGVIGILKQESPWVFYIWCAAHRLELSLKDALSGTCFDEVDEVLLRLYYLYEKSPKKLRQLKDLHSIYRQTYEFEEGSVRPKRASGTRWITHKLNALQLVIDKYGIYLQHLQNMAEDQSFKSIDRQKFKGYLKKWQNARIPLLACLFVEILSPAKVLSQAFQSENIDIVSSASKIELAQKQLERLRDKDVYDLPTVKRFLGKVTENDEDFLYQDVKLRSFAAAKGSLQNHKQVLLGKVTTSLQNRLKVAENDYVKSSAIILNTEGWERHDKDGNPDVTFADDCLAQLYDHFQEPLTKAGLTGSIKDLLDEWHSLVQHVTRYLSPTTVPYLRVWRRVFDSQRKSEWCRVLLVIELLFTIPISNAKVERLFSLMNRVKVDSRASLGESTMNNLIRITTEGPKLEDFNPKEAIKQWAEAATRRPHQKVRKSYSKQQSASKRRKVLIDESSTESENDD